MKIEETIMIEDLMEYAKRNDYFNLTTREFAELDSKVSKALEKQIPKPPKYEVNEDYPILGRGYYCECGVMHPYWENPPYQTNYCGNCGQRLK